MPSIFSSGLDAFAHDPLDALQQFFSQPTGARPLAQDVFRLV